MRLERLIKIIRIGFVVLGTILIVVFLTQTGLFRNLFPRPVPKVVNNTLPASKKVTPPREVVNLQDAFAEISDLVKPAVVNISAVQIAKVPPHDFFFGNPEEFFRQFFGEGPKRRPPEQFRREGTGSGVIIDPEGYILTNNHVVKGADQLTVTLSSGKSFKGRVIGTDDRTDLAVIRIKSSNPFPYASLGDSGQVRIGDWVLAIGSPFGLEQTVTAGIISAIRQTLMIEGRPFQNLLQTDAAINQGNSGGPLVNLNGEVIGINTAIFAPTGVFAGVGFAIPVNRAKVILKDLIEKGYVERSWMGVEIVQVDDVIKEQFNLKSTDGALVNSVMPDSPAEKAGIKRGDVILRFNGQKVGSVSTLQDIVARTKPDKTVSVEIMRKGNKKTLKLKTAVMPGKIAMGPNGSNDRDKSGPEETKWLGAECSDLTLKIKQLYSIPEKVKSGIVVVTVPADSEAAVAGLVEGDVIRSINQKDVQKISDLNGIKNSVDIKDGIVLDVLRRGRWFYLSYKSLQ